VCAHEGKSVCSVLRIRGKVTYRLATCGSWSIGEVEIGFLNLRLSLQWEFRLYLVLFTIYKLGGVYWRFGGTYCRHLHGNLNAVEWTRFLEVSYWRYLDRRDNFGFKEIAEDQVSWDVTPCLWEFSDVSKERDVFCLQCEAVLAEGLPDGIQQRGVTAHRTWIFGILIQIKLTVQRTLNY
jgi:hypothetical protein